jgi:hypothetical protein
MVNSKIAMIGSVIGLLDLRAKEEPTEIQLPGKISPISERKQQLPRPSTSRTTMETPRQQAPGNSRYNSNVQVKFEPVEDTKMFFASNRQYPVHGDPRCSMLSPGDGNSQSRDPRKRPSKFLFLILFTALTFSSLFFGPKCSLLFIPLRMKEIWRLN